MLLKEGKDNVNKRKIQYIHCITIIKQEERDEEINEISENNGETSWANAKVKLHTHVHFESKKILGPKKF